MYLSSFLNVISTMLVLGGSVVGALSQSITVKQSAGPYTSEEQAVIVRLSGADIPAIKEYVREVIRIPLPPDYLIPAHVRSASSIDEAVQNVNKRYPQFVNKEGPDYLRAVAQDPIGYRGLILESRAVRRHFNKE